MTSLDLYKSAFKQSNYNAGDNILSCNYLNAYNYIIDNQDKYKTILDIGTGRGLFPQELEKNSDIDITVADLDNFADREKFIQVNLLEDPEKLLDISVDLVTAFDVLEHVTKEHIENILYHISQTGKEFIFIIPNGPDFNDELKIDLHTIQENDTYWDTEINKFFTITRKEIINRGKIPVYHYYLTRKEDAEITTT